MFLLVWPSPGPSSMPVLAFPNPASRKPVKFICFNFSTRKMLSGTLPTRLILTQIKIISSTWRPWRIHWDSRYAYDDHGIETARQIAARLGLRDGNAMPHLTTIEERHISRLDSCFSMITARCNIIWQRRTECDKYFTKWPQTAAYLGCNLTATGHEQ